MTEPLSFIHCNYSIFTNNENDLIMKRLFMGKKSGVVYVTAPLFLYYVVS